MTTNENVYAEAADVIRERGWTQILMESNDGGVCLMGALHAASGTPRENWDLHHPARPLLARTLGEQYPDSPVWSIQPGEEGGLTPWAWNDCPGRTQDEVIAILEKTALKLEEQRAAGD